jgi:hypothetical protein
MWSRYYKGDEQRKTEDAVEKKKNKTVTEFPNFERELKPS